MASESPFFLTKIECPICKTINEFETIRIGAYSETDRDTDFCPTGRQWRNPRYQAHNPLLYFTATCSNCFYTREFNSSFKDWKNDGYFKTFRLKVIKERHLDLLGRPESIIKAVGHELDPNRYPNETAILKLILAIIDETLNEKQMGLDIGRFYLRIAWIFREMERGGNPNEQLIKGYLIDIDNKFSSLKSSLESIQEKISNLQQSVTAQFDDEKISAELKSILFPIKDKYEAELGSFRELILLTEGKLEALEAIAQEHQKLALGTSGDNSMAGFHNHRSMYDFLVQMAAKWDGIPLNQKDAIKFAVKYYKSAFEDGRDIADGNQQIQASYLIAELSRRIGDYEVAKEYFNTTIRTGQEFIYKHKGDPSRTAMARRVLELAMEQGRANLAAAKTNVV
ncbi:MAG: DUF2225 domain-containing protein [candidate division Zixibacteria bacterium]|nr:DUF2225 domain-containing protein [candidate division Zixibacteria bacterium]